VRQRGVYRANELTTKGTEKTQRVLRKIGNAKNKGFKLGVIFSQEGIKIVRVAVRVGFGYFVIRV